MFKVTFNDERRPYFLIQLVPFSPSYSEKDSRYRPRISVHRTRNSYRFILFQFSCQKLVLRVMHTEHQVDIPFLDKINLSYTKGRTFKIEDKYL